MLLELATTTEMMVASFMDRRRPQKSYQQCKKHKCHAYKVTNENNLNTSRDTIKKTVVANSSFHPIRNSAAYFWRKTTHQFSLVAPSSPRRGEDGHLYVNLVGSHTTTYIAISYVWSDVSRQQ